MEQKGQREGWLTRGCPPLLTRKCLSPWLHLKIHSFLCYKLSFPALASSPVLVNTEARVHTHTHIHTRPCHLPLLALSSSFKVPSQLALLPTSKLSQCGAPPIQASQCFSSLPSFCSPDLSFPLGTRPKYHFGLRYILGSLHIWSHQPPAQP